MSSLPWPQLGRCGACGRDARQFPSGNWEHVGAPCRARSQPVWRVDDVGIRLAVVFVPAGHPLPTEPDKWHMHPRKVNADGIPEAFGLCNVDHTHTIREFLAAEAESRELAAASPEVQP